MIKYSQIACQSTDVDIYVPYSVIELKLGPLYCFLSDTECINAIAINDRLILTCQKQMERERNA